MRSNPIEPAPGMNEKREIHWEFENLAEMHQSPPRKWRRFGMYAALFVTAGLAMMFVPSVLNNWTGPADSAIKHQQATEQLVEEFHLSCPR